MIGGCTLRVTSKSGVRLAFRFTLAETTSFSERCLLTSRRKSSSTCLSERRCLVEKFVSKSEKIRQTLAERMAVMDSEGYENVLRPAFKQDEWKLILAGAVLGAVAGAVQLTFYL